MDEDKFMKRVEEMLYHICGCTSQEAVIILKKCLHRAKNKEYFKKPSNKELVEGKRRMEEITRWVNYIKTHSDKECSKQQNMLINSQFHQKIKSENQ